VHRLGEALGVLPGEAAPAGARGGLKAAGVTAGRFALFMPALLKPGPAALRAMLWAVWHNADVPALPAAGLVCAPAAGWDEGVALAMGWLPAGPVMIRLDVAERIAGELNALTARGPVMLPAGLCSRLSLKAEQLPAALNALGLRIIPAAALGERQFGPPAPPMLARRRSRATAATAVRPPLPDNPFAALAVLKRAAS
jgi:ATP-dependent RNA helicase SUPV3L1/SUV3